MLLAASVASMIDQFNMPNIRLLQQMGYDVQVACNFRGGNTCDAARIRKLQKELTRLRVIWHQWDCPRGTGSVRKSLRAYRQMLELLAACPYAWVHCHSPVGGALVRIAAHKMGIPVVYTAHGFHFYHKAPLKNWLLYYPVEKLLARWTDVLVTVNREDYRFARRKLGAGRVYGLPGIGVDTGRYGRQASLEEKRKFRETYGLPQDALLLLSVGELSGRKNHRLALAAVRELAAQTEKKVCYLICGQGPMRTALERRAAAYGIADAVRLTGFQEDVATFYRNADIFVFPSVQEGLPVALMEAMASGLPCVVSDIRGNRELIGKNFRFPLRAGASHAMAKQLERLLCDPCLRKEEGRRNQKNVQRYNKEAVQTKMSAIYANVSAEAGRDANVFAEANDTGASMYRRKSDCRKPQHPAPKISVLMGTYNDRRAYAAQAIDSILGQTFDALELIICDDGSEEAYFQWLRDYCQKDQRILLLRNPKNKGLSAALNRCLRYASGDYIARMDADDISRQDRLERQAVFLDRHKEYAFVGCSARLIAEHGPWGERRLQRRPVRRSFLSTSPFIHPAVMLRREVLEASGGYQESRKALRAEDYELFMRLYAQGWRGYNLPQLLLDYREDRTSYKKRRYRYRFCECLVRLEGFRRLGILKGHLRYVLKPLAAGLVPAFVMRKIRAERFRSG